MDATCTLLRIRPVRPDDRMRFAAMFERLSRESRYQRFLHPKLRLTDEELTYFTDVDHVSHEALAAIDPRDGSFVGVARYAAIGGDAAVVDLAFEVVDEWQGRGVGTMLVRHLLARAAENGVSEFVALTLSENAAARALLKRMGFRIVDSSHGILELRREESGLVELVA